MKGSLAIHLIYWSKLNHQQTVMGLINKNKKPACTFVDLSERTKYHEHQL